MMPGIHTHPRWYFVYRTWSLLSILVMGVLLPFHEKRRNISSAWEYRKRDISMPRRDHERSTKTVTIPPVGILPKCSIGFGGNQDDTQGVLIPAFDRLTPTRTPDNRRSCSPHPCTPNTHTRTSTWCVTSDYRAPQPKVLYTADRKGFVHFVVGQQSGFSLFRWVLIKAITTFFLFFF